MDLSVLGLHIPSLTHLRQLPALQAPWAVSALHRCTIFIFSALVYIPFLHLGLCRHTNTYPMLQLTQERAAQARRRGAVGYVPRSLGAPHARPPRFL